MTFVIDSTSRQRIGLFGGSFDPIHVAHLIIAERVREALQLHRVVFVPSAIPPHKVEQPRAAAADRYRMVELAIKDNPFFQVSDIELRREGVSYTIDTLREWQTLMPIAREDLFLIIGADNLKDLHSWRQPQEIVRLCRLAVVRRPDIQLTIPDFAVDTVVVDCPLLEISSTRLRQMVRSGQSIRYLVMREVEDYISTYNLYKN